MAKVSRPVADELIGVNEAAKILKRSPRQVRRLVAAGWIPCVDLPTQNWLFKRSDVIAVAGKLPTRGQQRKCDG